MEEDTAGHRESPPIKVQLNRTDWRLIRQSKVSAPRQFASRPQPTQRPHESADEPIPPFHPGLVRGNQGSKTEASKRSKRALLATFSEMLELTQQNLKPLKQACRRSRNHDPMTTRRQSSANMERTPRKVAQKQIGAKNCAWV